MAVILKQWTGAPQDDPGLVANFYSISRVHIIAESFVDLVKSFLLVGIRHVVGIVKFAGDWWRKIVNVQIEQNAR